MSPSCSLDASYAFLYQPTLDLANEVEGTALESRWVRLEVGTTRSRINFFMTRLANSGGGGFSFNDLPLTRDVPARGATGAHVVPHHRGQETRCVTRGVAARAFFGSVRWRWHSMVVHRRSRVAWTMPASGASKSLVCFSGHRRRPEQHTDNRPRSLEASSSVLVHARSIARLTVRGATTPASTGAATRDHRRRSPSLTGPQQHHATYSFRTRTSALPLNEA
jgi:hypothetical protein